MRGEGKKKRTKISLKEHLKLEIEELKRELEITDLPKKYEKHGDLLLLPQNCFTAEIWSGIDQRKLWDAVALYYNVTKVAKKGRICCDGKRTPQVVLLKGDDPWVCHVDNKIKYSYDITKCMFSVGNITEKMRMAKLNCEDEVLVDMFAGIGYFTLPLLVHAKARHVHACEWNSDAVVALRKNLVNNKVSNRCTVHEGDNRKVCPENVADRVIMGLIPTALSSLEAACKALKIGKTGTLHIHHNVDSNVLQNECKLSSVDGVPRSKMSSDESPHDTPTSPCDSSHVERCLQPQPHNDAFQPSPLGVTPHPLPCDTSQALPPSETSPLEYFCGDSVQTTPPSGNLQPVQRCSEADIISNGSDSGSGALATVSCNKNYVLPEWRAWAERTARLVERTMLSVYHERSSDVTVRTNVVHIEKVKSYAPHIDHMVLDLEVFVNLKPG